MNEREFMAQLWLLEVDMNNYRIVDPAVAQQRDRWAARLHDLLERRNDAREQDTWPPTKRAGP
jgi:hypothetical protein